MDLRAVLRLFVLTLLVGCSAQGTTTEETDLAAQGAACEPLSPRSGPLELFVLPDAGPSPYLRTIEDAARTLRVMIYELSSGPILDALAAKAYAGVDVRVILDTSQKSSNERASTRLREAGASVLWSDPSFEFMHAKVIVADERVAVISTGNYGARFMRTARDYVVSDADPADVEVLTALFDADFARAPADLSCTRLLVSPANARDRLLAFLGSAKKEILVESMQLSDRAVRSALAARRAAGIQVRVLLADERWVSANADAARFLTTEGIPNRQLRTRGLHAKLAIVDGQAAYVGSINFSRTSLAENREVGLLLDEERNLASLRATFERDWAEGQ
jgi:cardiolipin synthase A/B